MYIYIYVYAYIYIYKYIYISGECSNLTEARWAQYICHYENYASSGHHHNGFVATHALGHKMYGFFKRYDIIFSKIIFR